jgi:hypothetical protein
MALRCMIVFRLTLGLMGLDELHLRVLATSSEDLKERRNAQKGVLCHCRLERKVVN